MCVCDHNLTWPCHCLFCLAKFIRCRANSLECSMLLSSMNKYIHATMGTVQLSIASLGPLMLQNQKYV
jgi:hypothetical protein